MKPHFGQSDAAINKLAGCNSFPNAGKTFDLTELEQMSKEVGCSTPYEYLRQRDERIQQNIDRASASNEDVEPLLSRGYFGHEDGCDCAVCENMYFRELYLKRVAVDLEATEQRAYKRGFDAAKRQAISAIEDIPTRVEAISGQNFTYIQRGEAIGTVADLKILVVS